MTERGPIRPRALFYFRPDMPRVQLCRAAEAHERHQVESAVRSALALVGYELLPARRAGPAARRLPRIKLGRHAFYLRRTGPERVADGPGAGDRAALGSR